MGMTSKFFIFVVFVLLGFSSQSYASSVCDSCGGDSECLANNGCPSPSSDAPTAAAQPANNSGSDSAPAAASTTTSASVLADCSTSLSVDTMGPVPCKRDSSFSISYQELVSACVAATKEANNSCDDSQNSGLDQAQQAIVVLGRQSSSSVFNACTSMGKIAQTANAATAAYQASCQNSVSSCNTACSKALAYFNQNKNQLALVGATSDDVQESRKTCAGFQNKADLAQQALQNFLNTSMQAKSCSLLTAGTDLCKNNPNLAGCAGASNVDCTKPEMASNKVCICSKNPNDPSCLSTASTSGASNVTTGSSTSSSTIASKTGASDLSGDINGLPTISQAKADSSGVGGTVDGKQGGGANLGGDSGFGGGAGAGAGGARGAAESQSVNAGFYGGGGGSSGSGSSYRGGSGVGGYAGSGMNGKSADGLPNLRQFLPGGQFDPKARGLAGASGPDGITGPHSDIWQKIQNRYQLLGPSLMP